jgi:gas vesicle protein
MSTDDRSEKAGGHTGTLLLATVLGVGLGLLAAPQAGTETRRALRKRLAAMGEEFEDELDELRERGGRARSAVRERAEELRRKGKKAYESAAEELESLREEIEDEEDEGGSPVATALTVGAGLAALAYLLTSDRAAPARERVREAAATVRDEAEARWDQFQRRRGNGQPTTESGTRIDAATSIPQGS